MYITPGAGADSPRGQNFDVNRKALSLYPFVASFKNISLKSDFILFFELIHIFSPEAGWWGGSRKTTGNKILMSTDISCHFGHLLLVSNHRRQ